MFCADSAFVCVCVWWLFWLYHRSQQGRGIFWDVCGAPEARLCVCVHVCVCVQGGVCPKEAFASVCVRERLAVSRPLCLCVFLSLGVYASGICMCCICRCHGPDPQLK